MPRRFHLRTFRLPAFSRPTLGIPRGVRPPLALALVGGAVATLIVTGHPVTAKQPAARPVTQTAASSAVTPLTGPLTDGVQVARALDALARDRGRDADPARASRSHTRAPLHRQRAPQHRWVRPNSGPLTSPFGYRWGRLHAGIDLAGPYGSPILAATDGCITYAGPMAGYGEVMQITDWDGTQTVYGHMSAFERTSGCVKAGQVIARVGAAGDATGAHLHFEVHVGGAPVDPIPFLAKRHLYI